MANPAVSRSDALAPSRAGARRRPQLSAGFGLVPYLLYMTVLLVVPIVLIAWSAFQRSSDDGSSSFSFQNISDSLHGAYLTGLLNSVQLAAVTAVGAAIFGLVLAWAVLSSGSKILSQALSTSAAVLANFGGLPLAFLFVAVLGSAGVLTKIFSSWFGLSLSDDLHFSLYSLTGVEIVYLYFLIPLMVMVITPALEGIKPQWKEAASSLGASNMQYWRHVAAPVLLPQVMGAFMLLFCSAFSAFATASALTNGTLGITPLQIDSAVSGNVMSGQENLGAALALNMIVVVLPLTLIYQFLARRTSRWLR